ncbi:AfsR/SARP family transcriptional regulator [Sinomonas susongensis]|uniref:AfsR/SARP family transcriptional regulator n=1 Tax=Sinomonas susongensis TaxID=1324851 RepID=UPI001486FD47|nr:bacterial transcriptional activator domain-containing protein [Sinomonas susongensis]
MGINIKHDWQVQLLRQWELRCDGSPIPLAGFTKRVVAGIALAGPAPLEAIAGLLLPHRGSGEAAGKLEVEVLRIRNRTPGLLDERLGRLGLAPGVRVDLDELLRTADRQTATAQADSALIGELLDAELLPGWGDDWALFYRERVRLFRLAALEAMARHSLRLDEPRRAAFAARSASAIEPLRESSHALLIRALVLAGNLREAFSVHEDFRRRYLKETGAEPSVALTCALGLPSDAVRGPGQGCPDAHANTENRSATEGGC